MHAKASEAMTTNMPLEKPSAMPRPPVESGSSCSPWRLPKEPASGIQSMEKSGTVTMVVRSAYSESVRCDWQAAGSAAQIEADGQDGPAIFCG